MTTTGAGTRDPGAVVIVGGGLAGYTAAIQLRRLGHQSAITVVDAEPAAYDRPPLSKRLLDDDFSIGELAFATAGELGAQGIVTRFRRSARSIDPERLTVTLDDGDVLEADTVLLATGGRPRRLRVPGADRPEVFVLRTIADAAAIRGQVRAGTRVSIIGAGLIGAELASSLSRAGALVSLIDPVEVPLEAAMGPLLARELHLLHRTAGVELHRDVIAAIEPTNDVDYAAGTVDVVLDGGGRVRSELVIVGIGIVPNTRLAADAGLTVADGIVVGEDLQTSAPGVYAAGDVAVRRLPDGTLARREEHWEAAQLSGQQAAHGMMGLPVPTRGAPWFWTDRYGVHVEVVGRLSGSGEAIVREDGGGRRAFFLIEEGLLVGAAAIDDPNTVRAARRLIDQRVPVDARLLGDPDIAVRSLLTATRRPETRGTHA